MTSASPSSAPPPPKRNAQPEQVLGRGWRLWPRKIGLVAGSRNRLSPRGSGQPPLPSPRSWETAETETKWWGEKKRMRLKTQKMKWAGKAGGRDGAGPSQEFSLPLIPAPSWPPQPCPSSAGHTPSLCPGKNRHTPSRSNASIPGIA